MSQACPSTSHHAIPHPSLPTRSWERLITSHLHEKHHLAPPTLASYHAYAPRCPMRQPCPSKTAPLYSQKQHQKSVMFTSKNNTILPQKLHLFTPKKSTKNQPCLPQKTVPFCHQNNTILSPKLHLFTPKNSTKNQLCLPPKTVPFYHQNNTKNKPFYL